jgi:hypothetical protein
MDFKEYTQHNGINGVTGLTGYCQSRFFPRNTQSLSILNRDIRN